MGYYNTHLRKTSDPTPISKNKLERGMVVKIKYKKDIETKLYLVFVLQPKWPNTKEGKLHGLSLDAIPPNKLNELSKENDEVISTSSKVKKLDLAKIQINESSKVFYTSEIKNKKPQINLHLIGKLQTNKVKLALKIFDYIHSVDNKKLAKKIAEEEAKQEKKIKIFLQVNIGNEHQKSGVDKNELVHLYNYCNELNLNVLGLMCIPPINEQPNKYFEEMSQLNKKLNLSELSMGMSSDFLKATENHSTYLRIGSSIFGNRN